MSDNVRAHQEGKRIMEKTSRFNYIKRGLVGVCAATMLTGLCAGAAFAAPAEPNDSDYGTTGQTAINAELDTSNISVTVPTTLATEISSDGTIVFPSTAKMKNTSGLFAISIKSAEVTNGTDVNLLSKTAFETDTTGTKNTAWAQIGKNATADTDLITASMTSLDWSIPTSGDITLAFNGKIKDVNKTSFSPFLTVKWTVEIDQTA